MAGMVNHQTSAQSKLLSMMMTLFAPGALSQQIYKDQPSKEQEEEAS